MTDYYLSFVPLVSSPLVTMPPVSPDSDSDRRSDNLPDFLTIPRRGRRHWSEDPGRGLSVRYEVVKEKKDWKRRSLSVSLERLFCNGDGDFDGSENSEDGSEEDSGIVEPSAHAEQGRSGRGSRTMRRRRAVPRVGGDTWDADLEDLFPQGRFNQYPDGLDDWTGDGQGGVTFKQLLAEELLRLEAEEIMAGRPSTSSSMIAPEPTVQRVSAVPLTSQQHASIDDEDDPEELWFENADGHGQDTSSPSDGHQRWRKFRSLSSLTRRRRTTAIGNGGEGPEKEMAGRKGSAEKFSVDKNRAQPMEAATEGEEDIQSGCLPCSYGMSYAPFLGPTPVITLSSQAYDAPGALWRFDLDQEGALVLKTLIIPRMTVYLRG
ncbi:hypothetical protein EST38_g9201 [Candolleomyces aberdarensis]|uniref:Uncharacterized protein n=1 Tax=Candolleomyces aberdarensis TaxID=2316362 RepID=A0A4Q2DAI9_9AGAR|nr:hypothetical protein EST38_g9201 [Candolleomyces aberdarensis]